MLHDPKEYAHKVFAWAESVGLKQVRLVIHQPKVGGPTEDVVPLADLEAFATDLARAAQRVRVADVDHAHVSFDKWWPLYLNPEPNEDDCAYCRAMADCPAYRGKLERDANVDFGAVDEDVVGLPKTLPDDLLNRNMKIVPMMEDWCKAVRAEVERRLMAGEDIADFGLELGRQGNRKWTNPGAVETLLKKTYRLKMEDMYSMEMKSPTQIEKLTKTVKEEDGSVIAPKLGVKRWSKLQKDFIDRADAKPSVKLKSAIKVAWKPTPILADEFTPVVEDDEPMY